MMFKERLTGDTKGHQRPRRALTHRRESAVSGVVPLASCAGLGRSTETGGSTEKARTTNLSVLRFLHLHLIITDKPYRLGKNRFGT